jgi:eukaryotic-like serine/threonine-protein kinase
VVTSGLTPAAVEADNRGVSKAAAEVGSTANSYQILAKLATGGMAEIFLARGEGVAGVERYCVLKRILHDRASDVQFVQMFLDEARLAAQLQHPNIAQVYDIGKLGDSYFFTMEYVHGETVRALLHRAQALRRRLPITCVLTIAAGTAAGLHHAHTRHGRDGRALGIVHRDVSPSNLMVSYEGGVKVVDFGVAKAADRGHETKSGTVKGKISYLSPEQCKGKRVDRRSDLFSLGICMWEMLTTDRLYKRASDFDNMNAIVTEPTPPPSSRRTDVPAEVDELVLRLLAKEPDERFQTAEELVETIEEVASRTGSVLSSSALGRLVRELFGQRPEPWLEIESQQESGEAVTVTSEPIPRELAVPAGDPVNQRLASVVDLSPRSITESLSSLEAKSLDAGSLDAEALEARSPEVPTTRVARRAALGFPLGSVPPRRATIPLDTDPAPALPPPPVVRPSARQRAVDPGLGSNRSTPPSGQAVPALPGSPSSGSRTASPADLSSGSRTASLADISSASRTDSLGSAELLPASALDAPLYAGPSAPAGPPAPAGSSPAGLVGASRATPRGTPMQPPGPPTASLAAPGTQPPGPPTTSFTAGTQLPGPPTASFATADAQVPPPGAPSGFAASSSGSFVMLPGPHTASSGRRMTPAGPFASPASSHGSLRASAPYEAQRRGWPLYAVIAGAAVLGSIAVMVMMRSGAGVSTSAVEAATTTLASKPSDPAALDRAAATPGASDSITVVPIDPPPVSGQPSSASEPAAADTTGVPADTTADATGVPAAKSPPGPRRHAGSERAAILPRSPAFPIVSQTGAPSEQATLPDDEIKRAFAAGRYESVVEQCGARPVSAEHAPLCIIAACHAGNAAKASKLISAAPAAKRDQLIGHCKQLGVDITLRKAQPRPSAIDCEADPMACQH